MAKLYSLRLRSSVLESSQGFVGDITDRALKWKRSIRAMGGFWQGSFRLEGDINFLQSAFYDWLGFDLQERSDGDITWEGMIYEMDLVTGGVQRRRSFDQMANRIMTRYVNPSNETTDSAWVTNDTSIGRYGQKDEILALDGVPQPAAESARDRALVEWAWPWARPVGPWKQGDQYLDVLACGYIFTLNWRYVTQVTEYDAQEDFDTYFVTNGGNDTIDDKSQDFTDWETAPANQPAVYTIWCDHADGYCWAYLGETVDATEIYVYQDQSLATHGWNGTAPPAGGRCRDYYIRGPAYAWVQDIIDNDAEFLSTGTIETNYLPVNRVLNSPGRAWDVLLDVADLSDLNDDPRHIFVDIGRRFTYQKIETSPSYYLRQDAIYSSIGGRVAINPYHLRPGVVRDIAYPVGGQEYSGWLESAQDIYVEEVEVDEDGEVSLKYHLYDEAELLQNKATHIWTTHTEAGRKYGRRADFGDEPADRLGMP